jgi:hypothetical protein
MSFREFEVGVPLVRRRVFGVFTIFTLAHNHHPFRDVCTCLFFSNWVATVTIDPRVILCFLDCVQGEMLFDIVVVLTAVSEKKC